MTTPVMPQWMQDLPRCTVNGVLARYIPPSPSDRRRGSVAVWYEDNAVHPYSPQALGMPPNPKRPWGSAFMARLTDVVF
jgi:hypothetical protein